MATSAEVAVGRLMVTFATRWKSKVFRQLMKKPDALQAEVRKVIEAARD